MILRNFILCLLLITLLSSGPAMAEVLSENSGWEQIVPGIEYQKFRTPDPNNVFVVRMDRNNPNVTLESSIAQGKLIEGRETVSGMYDRYDQALNFWGGSSNPPDWGMRNQVVVAINGSYFDYYSGVPQGGQVQSGWYAKPYDKLGGWGGFAWKLDRSAFIGECLRNVPENQLVTFPETGVVLPVGDINDPLKTNEVVIFTQQYNDRTGTPSTVVDVLVEMMRPTLILPKPLYAAGIVREIHIGTGNSYIPFNHIVLSASGTGAETLLENIQVGSEVQISQDITSYDSDCTTLNSLDWTETYASIQGAFFYLKGGQIREFNDFGAIRRNPRTAIAFNSQYIYFIVVDGRDYYHSLGMTIHELAVFSRDILDATWGVAQDGGGSSTMVINGKVVNNTYCNIFTCSGYYAGSPIASTSDDMMEPTAITADGNVILSAAGVERSVANGMLMIVAEPGEYSGNFKPGDLVTTLSDTRLFLGPGTNYASTSIILAGTQGKIMPQINGLDGVLAKSSYWWYVNYDGVLGWVVQGELSKVRTSAETILRK